MEIPRRRGGTYEPRSAVGNILAPTSTPQHGADLRTTPVSQRAGASASPRPPWATELDAEAAPPSSGHSPAAPRQRSTSQARSAGFPAQSSPSWDNGSGIGSAAGHPPGSARPHSGSPRPLSGSQAPPVDQLDLWTQLQHHVPPSPSPQHAAGGRQATAGSDGVYSRVDHPGAPPAAPGAAAAGAAGRRAAPVASTAATPSAVARGAGAGGAPARGPRLQGGDMSAADARAAGLPPSGRSAGTGASAAVVGGGGAGGPRMGASPARVGRAGVPPRPAASGEGPGRSNSTPKPRPAGPPKRSTSITDNVRHDWVDLVDGPGDCRRPGGARGGSAGGGGGASRWDADPEGSDRGSWLYAGDAPTSPKQQQQPKQHRQPATSSPSAPPRSQARDLPASAGRGVNGRGSCDGGEGAGAVQASESWQAPRRLRPQSPSPEPSVVEGDTFEATLSPSLGSGAAARASAGASSASAAVGGGGFGAASDGGGGMSLGHGITFSAGGGAAGGGGGTRGNARQPQQTTAAAAESARQLQALRDENAQLREQVEHLQRLAAAAGGTDAGIGGSAGRRGAAARPSSAASAAGLGDGGAPTLAAAAAAGVALQQYKSQVIQLQRQVALMSREMEAKSRLGFEAEGVLLEVASRLAELTTTAVGGSNAAADGAGGGGDQLSRDQLLQLTKWSKQMLGRLRSEKSQSSKLFTQQDLLRGGTGGGGPAAQSPSWSAPCVSSPSGMDGSAPAPNWLVPFIAAGGNRFLLPGGGTAADDLAGAAGGGGASGAVIGPSVAAIACGQAALLADPLLAHRLEMQLAALAPRLAAVAVLLKTQVLPAMPWLGLEAADRLQAEVGEAAEGVAQGANALVSLCSLLPAGAAVFGEGPVVQEPKRRAAEVEAGRDSWLYATPGLTEQQQPPSPVCEEDGVISVPRLQASLVPLLRDRKAGGKALADILEPLRATTQSAASKRAVLEAELRFASRAAATHAEHMSHLMMSVGLALEECRGAKDAAAIKSYFMAATAVRQVLEAADALEIHPCETCLKALVEVIRVHRDTLDRLPDLLVNAPAADVEGRLLSKVEDLHEGFKKAISRLEAHKRRHKDLLQGGTGLGHGPRADDPDAGYAPDWDADAEDGEDGGGPAGGGRTRRGDAEGGEGNGGGGAVARVRPRTQGGGKEAAGGGPGGAGVAKPPLKPPKPRPEWTD